MNTGTCISCGDIGYLNENKQCVRCMPDDDDASEALDREMDSRIAREIDEGRARVRRMA